MLERLDTPALSLPTVGVNKGDIYAADILSYYEYKDGIKNCQQPDKRMPRRRPSQNSDLEASSFFSSIALENSSWSDCTYSSASSSDSCCSLSISPSSLINAVFEKSSANRENITISAAFESCNADRQNEDDQDELTDDEMTLFGDEVDMVMEDYCSEMASLNSFDEFTKKKEIRFVNQKSLLSSMLLHHHPPASASSSTLSVTAAPSPSSFTSSTGSSNHTNDVLSSSMKEYVHWEKIQNSGPAGKFVGVQKTNCIRASSSSTLHIKNSFDTYNSSCW